MQATKTRVNHTTPKQHDNKIWDAEHGKSARIMLSFAMLRHLKRNFEKKKRGTASAEKLSIENEKQQKAAWPIQTSFRQHATYNLDMLVNVLTALLQLLKLQL